MSISSATVAARSPAVASPPARWMRPRQQPALAQRRRRRRRRHLAPLGRETGAQLGVGGGGQIDDRLDPRLVAPAADQIGAGAAAAQQAQRLDDDALAGAGLAGDHGQSRPQLQLELVDEGKARDAQYAQHDIILVKVRLESSTAARFRLRGRATLPFSTALCGAGTLAPRQLL